MREKIHTIPVNDAFLSGDECPFCYLERITRQRLIRYVIGPGASYMEPEVRAATDQEGFCREHYKMLYDYGNSLGNGLMLQTYYACLLEELEKQKGEFCLPEKRPLIRRRMEREEIPLLQWAKQKNESCYICSRLEDTMGRYYATFFSLVKEPEFRQRVESCKGFCMHHFAGLLEAAQEELPNSQREWFYDTVIRLMQENMTRVKEDIDWFCGMFDYRQAGADWKNSRDAVSRGMQKLKGGYPADKPYKPDL